MSRLKAANNAQTTLTALMEAGATSCTVANGTVLPATPFRATIDNEIVEVRVKSGDNERDLSSILRAQEGTAAAAHQSGAVVNADLTAGMLNELETVTNLNNHLAENAIDAHATMPACRAYHNTSQSLANDTVTTLALNSELFDTDAIHDNSTNNSRLTCKTAGKYIIFGTIDFDMNSTGVRACNIKHNGSIFLTKIAHPATANTYSSISISTIFDLAVNDYVELITYQSSGGTLDVTLAVFGMVKVG